MGNSLEAWRFALAEQAYLEPPEPEEKDCDNLWFEPVEPEEWEDW